MIWQLETSVHIPYGMGIDFINAQQMHSQDEWCLFASVIKCSRHLTHFWGPSRVWLWNIANPWVGCWILRSIDRLVVNACRMQFSSYQEYFSGRHSCLNPGIRWRLCGLRTASTPLVGHCESVSSQPTSLKWKATWWGSNCLLFISKESFIFNKYLLGVCCMLGLF